MSEAGVAASKLDWRIEDVQEWFSVSRATIHRWMVRPENPLPHYRPGGGIARFLSEEVKAWGFSE